ncbi:BTAD domain-containing putative transcriptional regulator [Nonomuraea ferruginea]
MLLIEANRVVSADQILDRVWGEAPPQRARAAVHGYLCRLRRVLTEMDGVGLVRQPGGYALTADPMTVDLLKFRKLVAEAREAEEGGTALALFDRALRLWRGDLVAGHDSAWLNDVRHGVALERLAAELDRNDLVLDRGGHAGLLAELTASASAHPLDERIAGQLMLALYRCGRQAGALDVYERLRRLLAEELGASPHPGTARSARADPDHGSGPGRTRAREGGRTARPAADPASAARATAVVHRAGPPARRARRGHARAVRPGGHRDDQRCRRPRQDVAGSAVGP